MKAFSVKGIWFISLLMALIAVSVNEHISGNKKGESSMSFVIQMKEKVLAGELISFIEAQKLINEDIEELGQSANEIREHFCGNQFDVCTIINAKSGRCSEDCKYCAQSMHYKTTCEEYPLLPKAEIVDGASYNDKKGVLRYSLVTSGRNISDDEVEKICGIVSEIKSTTTIQVCGSFGILKKSQYKKLYEAGLTRIHNNLETSRKYFSQMCSTHSFDDKVNAINEAKSAGMVVCSGGIFGIGESVDDRLELAFSLRELQIKSVPVNLLSPIKGTPYEGNAPLTEQELRRIVAVYRFILPDVFIRLAGGRGLLADKGRSCFSSGANATITGDMLTTAGISIETDMKMVKELGFEVK